MAMISGKTARGHLEECRNRMMKEIGTEATGPSRIETQTEKENEYISKALTRKFGETEVESKKLKTVDERRKREHAVPSSGSGLKRDNAGKEIVEETAAKRGKNLEVEHQDGEHEAKRVRGEM